MIRKSIMNMSIEKVIEILGSGKAPETEQDFDDFDTAMETAINLLKTHPDSQLNDPLTPEQLRYMSGKPIWITGERFHPRWDLIRRVTTSGMSTYTLGFLSWEDCLKTWFARRRPEEG